MKKLIKFIFPALLLSPLVGFADQTGHLLGSFDNQPGWQFKTDVIGSTNCDWTTNKFTTDGSSTYELSTCTPGGTTLTWTTTLNGTQNGVSCNYTLTDSCKVSWFTGNVSKCGLTEINSSSNSQSCPSYSHSEQNGSSAYIIAVYNPPATSAK
ncbi:MAG: hypothetical protein A3F17_08685 [Gammaproteobacteria bacterium RIFCSPHIGHO2_12_FULL_41_15]|nr:MAG: hypothetical protein A3F17_08685 [Gammaproteobacteria bacterium RIFCSPHIGHO2_12_FULL_41_15]